MDGVEESDDDEAVTERKREERETDKRTDGRHMDRDV